MIITLAFRATQNVRSSTEKCPLVGRRNPGPGNQEVGIWNAECARRIPNSKFHIPNSSMAAEDCEEGGDDFGIELSRAAAQELVDGVRRIETQAIGAVLGHRVVGVDDRDDATGERDLVAGE